MPDVSQTEEEVARRGEALYERQIRPQISAADQGKFLVVDIDTGEYELDTSELVAFKRAKAKNREGVLYMLRVGFSSAYQLGLASGP